jgi:hypothetical protein
MDLRLKISPFQKDSLPLDGASKQADQMPSLSAKRIEFNRGIRGIRGKEGVSRVFRLFRGFSKRVLGEDLGA